MCAHLLGRDLRQRLDRDTTTLWTAPDPAVIGEERVRALPAVVRRYLRYMGVVGRPSVTSYRAHLTGSFRLRQGQSFLPVEVWQYNRVRPIARVFWMRIDLAGGLLPMVGRDSYVRGRGRLLGKLLDLVAVADGQGEPFDVGELTTWLNDAVLIAPSMLLTADASFTEVDDSSFDVRLTDAGRTVTARVHVNDQGAPVDFVTEDRYADLPGGPVRTRWSTPVEGWQRIEGRAAPTRGSAVWHLPDGDFTYAVLDFGPHAVEYDPEPTPPGDAGSVHEALESVGIAAVMPAMLLLSPPLRRRFNRWGATDKECLAPMPGDELVPEPRLESTRAVTIAALPEAVWPWLAQLGQGRGGLYSYDALENVVGLDIHSADVILPQHQQLRSGDVVRLGKAGSPCFRVASVEPGRALARISAEPSTEVPPRTPVPPGSLGATWQWLLQPVDGGTRTRLITRQRNCRPDGQRLLWRLVEPIGFVMERRMLLGIKQRAERHTAPQA